jgi:putative transposase
MVEEMLAARGISVTHETIRQWGALNSAANSPTASVGERLAVATNGTSMRLLFASLGRSIGCGVPLTRTASFSMFSSGADATRRPPNAYSESFSESRVEHRQHKGLNNRAENSHQPTRRRERIMKRFSHRGRFNAFFRP